MSMASRPFDFSEFYQALADAAKLAIPRPILSATALVMPSHVTSRRGKYLMFRRCALSAS
jgi:hypothetical protein